MSSILQIRIRFLFFSECDPLLSSKLPEADCSYDNEHESVCRFFTVFRPYLAFNHFSLLCDNKALVSQSLKGNTLYSKQITKLNNNIGQYSFDVKHITSSQDVLTVYLSLKLIAHRGEK